MCFCFIYRKNCMVNSLTSSINLKDMFSFEFIYFFVMYNYTVLHNNFKISLVENFA